MNLREDAREAMGDFLSFESIFTEVHGLEICVVDFDFRRTEIRDVEKFVSFDYAGSCALIDRAIRGAVVGIIDDAHGILPASPAGDRSIFCRENEDSGFAGSDQKIGVAAIEDHARRGRQRSRWGTVPRRNGYPATSVHGYYRACL